MNELFIGCKGNKLQFDVFPELSNESQDEVYHSLLLLSSQYGLNPKQGLDLCQRNLNHSDAPMTVCVCVCVCACMCARACVRVHV